MAISLLAAGTSHGGAKKPAVARQWHGKVSTARAAEYETYLRKGIKKFTTIKGTMGYDLLREAEGEVTHFCVISYWESRDAIHAYAGADISKVRFLPRDPEFLIDPEPKVRNYDLVLDVRQ